MIKNKGGKIQQFIFHNNSKNKDSILKNELFFDITLKDNIVQTFKITQHTFSHFDEFTNESIHKITKSFTHIMQFFILFIFLLNSMKLTQDDLINPSQCKSKKLKDTTCTITKTNIPYNAKITINNLSIFIPKIPKDTSSSSPIFITSLFEKNNGGEFSIQNIKNIEFFNNINKTNIHFSLETINNILKNQEDIIKNKYNINTILKLIVNDYKDKDNKINKKNNQSPINSFANSPPTNNSISIPIAEPTFKIYKFSIPKVFGGKKTKILKRKKYKRRKTRKK